MSGKIVIRKYGGAIGLNFIDIYQREGLYPIPLPFSPGVEAAGVIEVVGEGVENIIPGDRVAYFGAGNPGSYAEARVLSADRLVKLPDSIDEVTAAGAMLKGAIGTVGSKEKATLAEQNGCQYTILYRDEDIAARVKEITDGHGVDVVYDSVGKDTFEASLDSLKPRGLMVSFGNASGPVPDFAPLLLSQKGSLFLTRPTVKDYYATPGDFAEGTKALLDAVSSGTINVAVNQTYALREVQQAHRDLEGRKTSGSTVLIPA
jgi:NADPH2:quinone reductase